MKEPPANSSASRGRLLRWLPYGLCAGMAILIAAGWLRPRWEPPELETPDEERADPLGDVPKMTDDRQPSIRRQRSDSAVAHQTSGFESVGFPVLAGFRFDPAQEFLFVGTNAADTAARTLALVPDRVRALDGHKITVQGFAMPLQLVEGRAVEFLLMRDQSLCCFGITPQLNQWITVHVSPPGVRLTLDLPMSVSGVLRVGDFREGGHLVGIYELQAEKVFRAPNR